MTKKRIIALAGAALAVLLVAGLSGAAVVFAQEPTPPIPFGQHGGNRGFGGRDVIGDFGGHGMMGGFGGQWTMFDTAAETLGLLPEELFAELYAGAGMDEIAEEQGVELDALHEAVNADRVEARREAIEQAVEDGTLTQEQADWMIKGLEQGFSSGGQDFGRGRGGGYSPDGECPCGSH